MAYENLKAQIAEYNKLCDEKCAKTPERQNLKYNRVLDNAYVCRLRYS